jgi:hypothetical protein
MPIINYITGNKDCLRIFRKYEEVLALYKEILFCKENNLHLGMNASKILSLRIDSFGEYVHESLTDKIKEITIEIVSQIREHDNPPPPVDSYWKV